MDYTFEGKRKTLSLGKYPAVGLKEARARRDTAKTMLATGIDPSAEKKRVEVQAAIEEQEQALTFEAVFREWWEVRTIDLAESSRRLKLAGWKSISSPSAALRSSWAISSSAPRRACRNCPVWRGYGG
ncbi:integrase arm-type DNA-binding domain-containing protein [uncultured Bilophila sp.]|uniref:integrase arm-type DNA-binding domain-containing protein n=1 Tax=uncultured Bilophila sp. TaxID=529385 RepID=UPI00280C122D|nr:integrase arm-type DNA-binding domain-containing protein [uncultured Bilophila sp.]